MVIICLINFASISFLPCWPPSSRCWWHCRLEKRHHKRFNVSHNYDHKTPNKYPWTCASLKNLKRAFPGFRLCLVAWVFEEGRLFGVLQCVTKFGLKCTLVVLSKPTVYLLKSDTSFFSNTHLRPMKPFAMCFHSSVCGSRSLSDAY